MSEQSFLFWNQRSGNYSKEKVARIVFGPKKTTCIFVPNDQRCKNSQMTRVKFVHLGQVPNLWPFAFYLIKKSLWMHCKRGTDFRCNVATKKNSTIGRGPFFMELAFSFIISLRNKNGYEHFFLKSVGKLEVLVMLLLTIMLNDKTSTKKASSSEESNML